MLFFIDESWQESPDKKRQASILSAISIKSHDFNKFSQDVYSLKVKHLGKIASSHELKGSPLLARAQFEREKSGQTSSNLQLVRELFTQLKVMGSNAFASIVFSKAEIDLNCTDVDLLERPFLYLFERIDKFMRENHPGLIAKVIFDDREVKTNQRISKSVSNFFHKSGFGNSFDRILKVPFFAISSENAGIQSADVVGHVLGRTYTGDSQMREFHRYAKDLEYVSREAILGSDGKMHNIRGFKYIKEKEAGGNQPFAGLKLPIGGL